MKGMREFYATQEKFKDSNHNSPSTVNVGQDSNEIVKIFVMSCSAKYLKELDNLEYTDHKAFLDAVISKDLHGEIFNPVINILSTLYKGGVSGELSMSELLNELNKIINGI